MPIDATQGGVPITPDTVQQAAANQLAKIANVSPAQAKAMVQNVKDSVAQSQGSIVLTGVPQSSSPGIPAPNQELLHAGNPWLGANVAVTLVIALAAMSTVMRSMKLLEGTKISPNLTKMIMSMAKDQAANIMATTNQQVAQYITSAVMAGVGLGASIAGMGVSAKMMKGVDTKAKNELISERHGLKNDQEYNNDTKLNNHDGSPSGKTEEDVAKEYIEYKAQNNKWLTENKARQDEAMKVLDPQLDSHGNFTDSHGSIPPQPTEPPLMNATIKAKVEAHEAFDQKVSERTNRLVTNIQNQTSQFNTMVQSLTGMGTNIGQAVTQANIGALQAEKALIDALIQLTQSFKGRIDQDYNSQEQNIQQLYSTWTQMLTSMQPGMQKI